MKRYQKILLGTSVCLIIGGGILGVAGIALGGNPGFAITNEGVKTKEDLELSKFVEKSVPLQGVSSLEITCREGDVEFLEGDSFHVEYGYDEKHMQVKQQKQDAAWIFDSSYVKQVNFVGMSFFWDSIDTRQQAYLRVYIPRKTKLSELKVKNAYGTVKLSIPKLQAETIKIITESGNLEASGVTGKKTDLELDYGDLELSDCTFTDLSIKSESGSCTLSDMKAEDLKLEMDYGELAMNGVAADTLSVKGESGNLSLEDVEGKDVALRSDYGEMMLTSLAAEQSLRLENESGNISLKQVKTAKLDLLNESGSVDGNTLEIADGTLELSYGECNLDKLTVGNLKVTSECGGISLGLEEEEKAYSMVLAAEYGDVEINGENKGSNVTMERENAKNRLDLYNENGSITITTTK